MDLYHQELTVQMFLLRVLMVYNCWSTVHSSDIDGRPTIVGQVLIELDHEKLTVQILQVWVLLVHCYRSTVGGAELNDPLLMVNS